MVRYRDLNNMELRYKLHILFHTYSIIYALGFTYVNGFLYSNKYPFYKKECDIEYFFDKIFAPYYY